MRLTSTTLLLSCLAATSVLAVTPRGYFSAFIDDSGQLHLIDESGHQVIPAKMPGQVEFSTPLIAPDHRTVGWLAEYPDEAYSDGRTDSATLVLYRAGRVLHRFPASMRWPQVFYDWKFLDGSGRVAYCTGPTHGGAAECVLRDVESGRVLSRWAVIRDSAAPDWASGLQW